MFLKERFHCKDDDFEDDHWCGDKSDNDDDGRYCSACVYPVYNALCCMVLFQVQKLIEGNEYIFRVSAVNKEGTSKPLDSDVFTAKSPFGKPSSSSLQFRSL